MLEVEQKFSLEDRADFNAQLQRSGAVADPIEHHADTYYRHPCRDFVETGEAFRVRKINDVASVTYKGPKLRSNDRTMKARKEIEWCLAPGDTDGSQIEDLLIALGFTAVATVHKQRETFHWSESSESHAQFSATIDDVREVGLFAEIELLIPDDSGVEKASAQIAELAKQLGLVQPVRASYLEMLLDGR